MNRTLRLLSFILALFCYSSHSGAWVTISANPELVETMKDGIKVFDKAVDRIGPNLGTAVKEAAPAIGDEVRKTVPNLDSNITKASDAIAKAARSLSKVRALPIVGIGMAGAITSVVMISRGIENFIYADDDAQTKKAKWHILAGLIGLTVSGCVMGNSQAIFNFFSE